MCGLEGANSVNLTVCSILHVELAGLDNDRSTKTKKTLFLFFKDDTHCSSELGVK